MSVAKRSVALSVASLIIIAGSAWLWVNRQFLQDWQVVQSYEPTVAVAEIATRANMTDKGRFLFYASQPVVSEAAVFNRQCDRREAKAAILGCYADGRIYLYQVDSEELDGVEEVTAAHEMLHAVWVRLSSAEQERLGVHLETVYDRVATDELRERMKYYERQQPGQRHNELHSILATEFVDLNDELDQHYAQYFSDRRAVVSLYTAYEAVFSNLKDQAEQLRQEAVSMLARLNADITAFNTATSQLDAEILAHNRQTDSVDRTSASEVAAYNARQQNLMARRAQLAREEVLLGQRRDEYQALQQRYNELAIRSETLNDSLDSLKAPSNQAE